MGCGSQKSMPELKVIRVALIGSRESGKSSLISCFLMRRFNLAYEPTIAANVGMKSYSFADCSAVATLEVWELNEVKGLPTSFNAVILTLDCTRDPLDLAQDLQFHISTHQLLSLSRPFAIAITKADAMRENRETLELLKKTLGAPEGVRIYITSAKDQEGIDSMFRDLAKPEMPANLTISRDTSVAALNEPQEAEKVVV